MCLVLKNIPRGNLFWQKYCTSHDCSRQLSNVARGTPSWPSLPFQSLLEAVPTWSSVTCSTHHCNAPSYQRGFWDWFTTTPDLWCHSSAPHLIACEIFVFRAGRRLCLVVMSKGIWPLAIVFIHVSQQTKKVVDASTKVAGKGESVLWKKIIGSVQHVQGYNLA